MPQSSTMTFSGDLRGISLVDVFQNIAANRGSGTLHVRWRNTERFVRFETGQIAGFSLGTGKGLPIPDHLVQRGYVDATRLSKLMTRRKRSRKSPGRIIVEAGLLSQEELTDAVGELIAEHVYDLMLLREAEFTFTQGEPPPRVFGRDQQSFAPRLEASPLLVEGARRADEWDRIHRVIGSDRDLFILLEGWEEQELNETTAAVAAHLDGRTDVRGLLQRVAASRFAVVKAVSDLVSSGAARPCTAEEIEGFAREALEHEDMELALRLIRQALELGRSNGELRRELADLLERVGRPGDAATEHALLGHQAAQDGDVDRALEHYERAAELNPSDPVLRERRVELLRTKGDTAALAAAVLELSAMWLAMGLADRARTMLRRTLDEAGLGRHEGLLEQLAEMETRLGDVEEAVDVYHQLVDQVLQTDEPRALALLRRALRQCPDDESLQSRLHDIESGQRARRRRRRRRLLAAGATASVLLAFASAGVAELVASRQVVRALDQGLDSLRGGRVAATISDLREVHDKLGWTPSGHRAAALMQRLLQVQLDSAGELARAGSPERALAALAELEAIVAGSPLRESCAELRRSIELERTADALLERVAGGTLAGDAAAQARRQLADPRLLDFHLRRLQSLEQPRARQTVLRALLEIDHPRALAVAARVYLTAADSDSLTLLQSLLERAEAHRRAGHESEWADVYGELESARLERGQELRAKLALRLLRGE